jgi:signal transduction histidine kinase
MLNILIVDDDDGDRKQVRRTLKQAELACECVEATSIEEALDACEKRAFDCAVVDYRMPRYDGLRGIAALHERLPFMAIIMATGQGDEMVATEAMKLGASDYITKGQIDSRSIRRSIENAMEKTALRRTVAQQQEELENFASVLVHDLSAPIASMQIFARAIEDGLQDDGADKSEIIDHCRDVISAGRRTGALIDTLYEYTQANVQVALKPVDMRQVMENAQSALKHVIQQRRAQVTHGALPLVNGNAPQLMQLLQNLIGNGIKYCDAMVPTVHVAASLNGHNIWRFTVQDNGIGLGEEDYQRVFEPFKRLHDTSRYEGTGLGLATCKKIVERHGGLIRCESREGEGTTFSFTLQGVPT